MRTTLKKRTASMWILIALVLTSLVAPAWAAGPSQRPDGVGNPSGVDYTGYTPVYLILGVQNTTSVFTRIECFNGGNGQALLAVQAWDFGDVPTRAPVADQLFGDVPPSDVDSTTSSTWSGAPELAGIARISYQRNGRGKPIILCHASIRSVASPSQTVAVLDVISYTPKPARPRLYR